MPFGASRRVAAVAALIAAVGCTSSSSSEPPPPPTLQVYGRDIVGGWANVEVLRGGVGADARVVVNGAVLERSARDPGLYSGPLPAQLAPGDAVSLEVTSGKLRVTGTGALPDPPFILAAYTSAPVASDGDIMVTWTSPTDPDSFEVYASCRLGGWRFAAPGSSRLLTIPKYELPPGESVGVSVRAYDDGTMEGDYAPFPDSPGMNISSESGLIAVVTGATAGPPPTLEVRGQDIGEAHASVIVTHGGQAVDDAVVTVNGVAAPLGPERLGAYVGSYPRVFAGDPIVLEVTREGLHVTGVGALPDTPFVTAPTNGTGFAPDENVVVSWTSPTDPDSFEVHANWSCGPSCGTGAEFAAPGSARQLAIPHGALPPGTIDLRVFAYDDGTFTGDYAPFLQYPGMNIRAESGSVTIAR
jgi:hypothetical protein